jgi:type IV secretory pathway VirB2 component (pilin)
MMTAMPPGAGDGSALVGAAQWLEGLVQGQAATAIAVIAVAATGMLMLNGRMPLRRGLTVGLGCFLLFGASTIARGIVMSATSVAGIEMHPSHQLESIPDPPLNLRPPPAPPPVDDPYAGASVVR